MFNWTARGKLALCLRTSRRLMGWIELWPFEPSGGLQKDRPLSFQSDYRRSALCVRDGTRFVFSTCLSVDENGIWRQVAMDETGIVVQELQCLADLQQALLYL